MKGIWIWWLKRTERDDRGSRNASRVKDGSLLVEEPVSLIHQPG